MIPSKRPRLHVPSRHQAAQVMVLFAIFLVVLMLLAGSAYDYGSIVLDDAKLQNAVDSPLGFLEERASLDQIHMIIEYRDRIGRRVRKGRPL